MQEGTQSHDISTALGRIPQGLFILTARHEDRRAGMLASWVQQAGIHPPMISIAVAKGRAIMPLISDSRAFGLCQLARDDKSLLRRFAGGTNPEEDPFISLTLLHPHIPGLPILAESLAVFECEVTCHVDAEGDHDIFVGAVVAARCQAGEPFVHLRENGFKY